MREINKEPMIWRDSGKLSASAMTATPIKNTIQIVANHRQGNARARNAITNMIPIGASHG